MLILDGGSALTAFKLERVAARVRQAGHASVNLSAHFFYLVDPQRKLDQVSLEVLEDLLDASDGSASFPSRFQDAVAITPRAGTRSPWSTKATEIVHHCGLDSVRRVERGVIWRFGNGDQNIQTDTAIVNILHDKMIESVATNVESLLKIFENRSPGAAEFIDLIGGGIDALKKANQLQGFALTDQECGYLYDSFLALGRNPTDTELMMFAQVNSEHCRHKIFNASWMIDQKAETRSLFGMIRQTHAENGAKTLVAYADNAAVIKSYPASWFLPRPDSAEYAQITEPLHMVLKVETHNHPTAISPFPGAATGSGGEIRDEGATGRGGKPKAGVTGFSVSNLRVPGLPMSWELAEQSPSRIALPLQIMLEAPVGAASFNNEFGRPNIAGYFRTLETLTEQGETNHRYGYHKPIMIAGGMGNIRGQHVKKQKIEPGAHLVVLGGPAMLIGLGGGAASSVDSGESNERLDFTSVQRGNAEMQRRCQEVIDRCISLGDNNPIVSIHDVGAGGLSNALPELVSDAGLGAKINLDKIPSDDSSLSPMQLWCNEAQERYVLAIAPQNIERFRAICVRERCLFSVVGEATEALQLQLVNDGDTGHSVDTQGNPVDLPMSLLFGNTPRMHREVRSHLPTFQSNSFDDVDVGDALDRVLRLPVVADKTFLITIGDRSVGGQIARDQMVGPWQVPVADAGITTAGFDSPTGEAIAIGERAPLALINPVASGRMAVAEAIMNIASAGIAELSDIHLCANWMAAAGEPGQDAALFETVEAVATKLCPALGISIPVGKDSMSMTSRWHHDGEEFSVRSPLSLVITAFAPVADVRRSVTPELDLSEKSVLLFVDLAQGQKRLGGSALAQVHGQVGTETPDVVDPCDLVSFFAVSRHLLAEDQMMAYHDRSDGGLVITLLEMAFASRCSLEIDIGDQDEPLAALFSEEIGAVLQVRDADLEDVMCVFEAENLRDRVRVIGHPVPGGDVVRISAGNTLLIDRARSEMHSIWSELTAKLQSLRDEPTCALAEHNRIKDLSDPGLHASLAFDLKQNPATQAILSGTRPQVAILREQGVNGHMEMAAAFDRGGFRAIDVTMSDLKEGRQDLQAFKGLVACGGFSYGDVLGAGMGWAKSILFEPTMRAMFAEFFFRQDTFALGICNGCQMIAGLKELVPGAEHWPRFSENLSGQFESRVVMVEIIDSDSILFDGMQGSRMPVVVAHGEGRAEFSGEGDLNRLKGTGQWALRYVDNYGHPTERFPFNPNGSPSGVAGLCAADGRVNIMMPHPERNFRTITNSWHPKEWGEHGPWLRIFQNARKFIG
jgi:phosphoribosylformylglycinamidine synthase